MAKPHFLESGSRLGSAAAALRLECDELTVDVPPGSVVDLVGAPAGPSALIDQLVGASEAAHWRIVSGGVELKPPTPRQAMRAGVGYVSGDRANKGLLHSLPIVDNLMAARQRAGRKPPWPWPTRTRAFCGR